MKVHELITRLQNFDMDLDVKCLHADTDWGFDGESSFEFDTVEEGLVEEIEFNERTENSYILIK